MDDSTCLPLGVFRHILVIQRCQILCQFDAAVVEAIQLFHYEVKVRGEVWSCGKTPEQGGYIHEGCQ